MTLTLNLPPELEQYLLDEANQRGLSVDVLALQSWIDDDIENQQETGQYLIQVLDEDRLSERKLFPLETKGIAW